MTDLSLKRHDVPKNLIQKWSVADDPDSSRCPFRAAGKLHQGPPVFFNIAEDARNGASEGAWVVTRVELQREILQNPELFSSEGITGFSLMLGEGWPLMPVELDPPAHGKYRGLLNKLFSPARINELDAGVRVQAKELIGKIVPHRRCEFVDSFGRPFPVGVFLRLLGLPVDQMDMFRAWEDDMMHSSVPATRLNAARTLEAYLKSLIAERHAVPTDDLVSFLVTSSLDGEALSDEAILGICFFFFIAGLDTVAATLGFIFRDLAENPHLQRRLRAAPDMIPNAMEEMIRAYGAVTTSRYLTRDHVFHGIAMRKGDRVTVPLGVGGRDPTEFAQPNLLDFDRQITRNISFGAGPHRCIGSHLARREIKIALEEWIKAIPEFRLDPSRPPKVNAVTVWGFEHLSLVW